LQRFLTVFEKNETDWSVRDQMTKRIGKENVWIWFGKCKKIYL